MGAGVPGDTRLETGFQLTGGTRGSGSERKAAGMFESILSGLFLKYNTQMSSFLAQQLR